MKFELGRWLIQLSAEKFEGMIGINSYFDEKSQIGFSDLDKCSEKEAEGKIRALQLKHKLSDALLIQSSKGNYHSVFFDLKPFSKWLLINLPINKEHCGYSVFRGVFVLRVSKKEKKLLKFVKIITSSFGKDNKLSLNHLEFFEKHFGIDLSYLKKNALLFNEGEVLLEFYNARVKKL